MIRSTAPLAELVAAELDAQVAAGNVTASTVNGQVTDLEVALSNLYADRLRRLIESGTTRVLRAFDAVGNNEVDVADFAATSAPIFDGLGSAAKELTSAYYAARGLTGVADRAPVAAPDAAHPFIRLWSGLKQGEPFDQALAAARNRARTLVVDQVMRGQHAINRAAQASPDVVGWRRVPQGATCSYCILVSTQRYRSADTARAPGHRQHGIVTCDCRIEPIIGTSDPGRVINSDLLAQWKAAQRAPGGPPAYFDVTPDGAAAPGARPPAPAELAAQAAARAQQITGRQQAAAAGRAEARTAAELEQIAAARAAARVRGPAPAEVLARWDVTELQYLNARAVVDQVRADIRAVAAKEATELGRWLQDNDLYAINRPERLQQRTDIVSGARRSVRTQSGYDFLEQLTDAELARVRKRMQDTDLFAPDLLAEQVRRKTNTDMGDDEAMQWLVERWLQEDGLRSLASGRIPRYAEVNNLIPADYALEGYDLTKLFGVEIEDAAGHVASVQATTGASYARRILGKPSAGPPPWEMDAGDYLRELEAVEQVLDTTQLAEGIDPGQAYEQAAARIRELAPPDLDPTGTVNPVELYEAILATADTAGLRGGRVPGDG